MKNLAIILTLLATLAIAGCGSDEKSSSAPAKAPTSSSTTVTEQVKQKQDAADKSSYEHKETVTKSGAKIIENSDGTKTYTTGKRADKYKLNNDAKLGHFKPAN